MAGSFRWQLQTTDYQLFYNFNGFLMQEYYTGGNELLYIVQYILFSFRVSPLVSG